MNEVSAVSGVEWPYQSRHALGTRRASAVATRTPLESYSYFLSSTTLYSRALETAVLLVVSTYFTAGFVTIFFI